MAQSPGSQAVDDAVTRVVAPPLRERGFRRAGLHWWHVTGPEGHGGTVRVVSVLTHRLTTSAGTLLTLELGFAYPGLGEPAPERHDAAYCAHRHRIGDVSGDGTDLWWDLDTTDPSSLARTTGDLHRAWSQDAVPFVDGAVDPAALVDRMVRARRITLEIGDLALRLGDPTPLRQAVTDHLTSLRHHHPGERSTYQPFPEQSLVVPYAVAAGHLDRLGDRLDGADRERALAALTSARRAAARDALAPGIVMRADLVRSLAEHVGADVSFLPVLTTG